MTTLSFSQFAKRVQALGGDLNTSAVKAFREAAEQLEIEVVSQISNASPFPAVDTGYMRQSVTKHNLPNGASVSVDAPYSAAMEFGTRPFTPPLGPLKEWAMRKFGVDESQAYAIAKGAQKTISERGIAPRHFYKKSWESVPRFIRNAMRSELERLRRSRGG